MNSTIGVSKTTNNVSKPKSNNTKSPKNWITNVKQLIGSINLFIPTNQAKNKIPNNSILKNNDSIDIPNIKMNLDKINNKLNLITKFSLNINQYIDTQPNLIYPKPTSNFNQNNIDSLRQNVEKRLVTLKQLKESLTIYNTSIDANKAAFVKSVSEQINKFISDKYISALNVKKQELTGINTQITNLVNTIKQNLGNNKPINKNYAALSNTQLNKNNTLKKNLATLKQSLANSLKNITLNTSSTNQAFINYNQLYKKTAINLNNKHRNINKSISNRINKLSANIINKTEALNTLMESINAKINDLQTIIKGNNTVFSPEQKTSLTTIIGQLSESVNDSTTDFIDENNKLKAIVVILKKLIGAKNNGNKMNNARVVGPIRNNSSKTDNKVENLKKNEYYNTNNQEANNAAAEKAANNAAAKKAANNAAAEKASNNAAKKAANNAAAAKKVANNVAAKKAANNAAVKPIAYKKMKNLTKNNMGKNFTYKKKGMNIGFKYLGKTNSGKFRIIRNGQSQEQQLSNANIGLLNKNIIPKL